MSSYVLTAIVKIARAKIARTDVAVPRRVPNAPGADRLLNLGEPSGNTSSEGSHKFQHAGL